MQRDVFESDMGFDARDHRKKIVAAAFLMVCLGSVYAGWQFSKARTFQLFGDIVPRVGTDEKVVALTFDDAPGPYTPDVLDILKAQSVRATFFAVGSALEKDPGAGKRIAAAGHDIGDHSYSHVRMVFKGHSFIKSEVERTDALIRATGYAGDIYFRPPYGKKLIGLPWYLAASGRTTVMWDVEPESFPDVAGDAELTKEYVIANARPGSIILLHGMCGDEVCAETRKALPGIIKGLRAEGYAFLTISELLRYR